MLKKPERDPRAQAANNIDRAYLVRHLPIARTKRPRSTASSMKAIVAS
jgi:hypothetical protein